MISKTHISALKLRGRQLNAKVCGRVGGGVIGQRLFPDTLDVQLRGSRDCKSRTFSGGRSREFLSDAPFSNLGFTKFTRFETVTSSH